MRRGLDTVQIERRVEHGLDRGDDQRERRGLTTGHHGVDRELFERRQSPERRHHAERSVARRSPEHRPHAGFGRRHDRQAVAPLPFAEGGEHGLGRVEDCDACCSGEREAGLDRGWPERGAARLRTRDLARLARATTDWLSEQVCQLVDGLASSSGNAFATLAAERMLDRDERKPGDTERGELAPREPLEHRRADDRAGSSRLRQLDGVVETPRRAGSSVG